jgi:hypothetical protein
MTTSVSVGENRVSLFSAGVRVQDGPRTQTESDYAFLDRSPRAICESVRQTLDKWYLHLPDHARESIRSRFSSNDLGHHRGALLEIYLHECFRQLEYEIDLDIGREDPDHVRPDFLFDRDGVSFYLEASAALGADVLGNRTRRALAAAVYDAIAQIDAPDFFLMVDIVACGDRMPARRDLIGPLKSWLAVLDADVVLASYNTGGLLPEKRLTFDGWNISVQVVPVSPEHRGAPDHEVLGSRSEGFAEIDDASQLRSKLKRKGTRYGQLDRPYVVALLCAGDFVEDRDIADALLGTTALRFNPYTHETGTVRQLDGFWHGPKGPQNTRVSALITIAQLNWGSAAVVGPTVWLNPWAARPLRASLPWRTYDISSDGHFTETEATVQAHELLDLPETWPL